MAFKIGLKKVLLFIFLVLFVLSFGGLALIAAHKMPDLCLFSFKEEKSRGDFWQNKKGFIKDSSQKTKIFLQSHKIKVDFAKPKIRIANIILPEKAKAIFTSFSSGFAVKKKTQDDKPQELIANRDYWEKIKKKRTKIFKKSAVLKKKTVVKAQRGKKKVSHKKPT